jgi:hypothetical protein
MTVRPDLPPGVSVKFIEPNDTAYPKWARGKWSTSYGEGHGIDGYDTREEALDCTWTSWTRFNPDPWVVWADHETARVNAAEAARDEARAEVTRLRARVRVEAEDVERAGLKLALVHAWERTNGHRTSDVDRLADEHALARGRGHGLLAQFVRNNARVSGRPGLDILDEMAAMPLGPRK